MSKVIKWGILSTGRIAKTFATALKSAKNCELYAVGSRDIESAKNFAEEFNISHFYGSYAELVSNPEIDVIYVATPHNLHLENTLLALDNNKHVLCEKPLGVNAKEVIQMIKKSQEKNLFLMEALWSRFLPNIMKTKELIESGEIGEINLMTASFCIQSNNGPEHRHFNIDLCGGTILDIGIYNIFLSLYLFGKPESINAAAILSNQGGDNSSSYSFIHGQTLSVMHSSFMASHPYVVAEIQGSKGKIQLDHLWFWPGNVRVILNDGNEYTYPFKAKCNGYEYEAEEVAECILSNRTQSTKWSLKESLLLAETMDTIRKECGVIYPKHDL